jgi:hypothetical protein
MLHPVIAYDIATHHRRAMLAQAATIAQARAAQRPRRAGRGRPASWLVFGTRLSLRPRAA